MVRILTARPLAGHRLLVRFDDGLEADDLKACILFARRRMDHPVLTL